MLSNEVTSLPCHYIVDYDDAAGIDCNQTAADVAIFPVPFKCQVYLAGLVVTETCAGTTSTPVVKFDKRVTAGSDTSRTDGTLGALTLSTTAAGKMMYDTVARGEAAGILEPGEEVVVQLVTSATGTGAAGHIRPVLLVKYWAETAANLADMTETA